MNSAAYAQQLPEPIGLNPWARKPVLPLLICARKALSEWRRDHSTGFPYESLLGYYRAVGRNGVDASLNRQLRECLIRAEPQDWLTTWISMATDAQNGTYDSYLGTELLQGIDVIPRLPARHAEPRRRAAGTGATPGTDTVILALLAGLCQIEAARLRRCPTACAFCRRRVRALRNALRRADEFAPMAANLPTDADLRTYADPNDPNDPNDPTSIAGAVDARTPAAVSRIAEISLLPTTAVHDEIMFLRSVQMLELLYRQVARAIESAWEAAAVGDLESAADLIGGCTRRVRGTAALYRVVTTISPESFDVIRAATDGRSAVQSRAFRDVERLCGEIPPAVRQAAPERRDHLLAACAELESAWCAMKRSHWGIARKVIGDVPGTGGTSGASYLQARLDRPLFAQVDSQAAA